jgi:hypothetical protein
LALLCWRAACSVSWRFTRRSQPKSTLRTASVSRFEPSLAPLHPLTIAQHSCASWPKYSALIYPCCLCIKIMTLGSFCNFIAILRTVL